MPRVAPQPEIRCPRCGYDQRGAMATWQSRGVCDLKGTCSECGLRYDWVDVFDPGRMEPMWCVEYARGRWSLGTSIVKTAALQALPWLFWRRVAMHHDPHFPRIILYVLVLLVTLYPALMIGQGKAAWQYYHEWSSLSPPPPNPPPTISDWQAVGWSMLLPLSRTSAGPYLAGGTRWRMFPAPSELLHRNWLVDYGWGYNRTPSNFSRLGPLAAFWFSLLLLMPLSFALLPQTRRIAKVRWRHIMRIALYSVAFTMPLLWWAALWQVPDFGLLGVLGMCGINLVWWGFGCGAYLHLPRPWFVASMLTIMLLLLGIALQYHFLHDVFIRNIMRWG